MPGFAGWIESLFCYAGGRKVVEPESTLEQPAKARAGEFLIGESLPFGELAPRPTTLITVLLEFLERHLLIVGPSGSGKSVFLRNYIFSMLAALRTVVTIGYRSNDAEEIIACLVERDAPTDGTTLYDFGDTDWVLPLNFLGHGKGDAFMRANDMFRAVEAEVEAPLGVQVSLDFRTSLVCAAELRLSLLEVELLLAPEGDELRSAALVRLTDEYTKEQLSRYAALSKDVMAQRLAAVSNKLAKFLHHPHLRRSLGCNSALDLSELVERPGHLSLISLNCDRQPNAGLIGRLLLFALQAEVMSRISVPLAKRNPVSIVCDEFSHLADPSAATLLEEARKVRCSLVVAFQQSTQVSRDLYHSLTTNCSTQLFYQCPGSEVSSLASEAVSTLSREEMKRQMLLLPVGCALLLLRGKPAALVQTPDFPVPVISSDRLEEYKARIRATCAKKPDEVDREIQERRARLLGSISSGEPAQVNEVRHRRRPRVEE